MSGTSVGLAIERICSKSWRSGDNPGEGVGRGEGGAREGEREVERVFTTHTCRVTYMYYGYTHSTCSTLFSHRPIDSFPASPPACFDFLRIQRSYVKLAHVSL